MPKPSRAQSTTIEDKPGITPTDAWSFLKKEDYEKTSLNIQELEHDAIRIHGVEMYDGIGDKQFAVMEVSYIRTEDFPEGLDDRTRFSLRTGAAMIVKLCRDIQAAKENKIAIGTVPIRIVPKGQSYKFEPVEDLNPPEDKPRQTEIPF